MTATEPDLPQYLVDAAARFDNLPGNATDETKREALAALKSAVRQAHVDLYTITTNDTDTTTLKEAA